MKTKKSRLQPLGQKELDNSLHPSFKNWNEREPWVVRDDYWKREWLAVNELRYFLVQDKQTGEWSVCDRWWDLEFDSRIRSKNKSAVVRKFFKLVNRPIPTGQRIF